MKRLFFYLGGLGAAAVIWIVAKTPPSAASMAGAGTKIGFYVLASLLGLPLLLLLSVIGIKVFAGTKKPSAGAGGGLLAKAKSLWFIVLLLYGAGLSLTAAFHPDLWAAWRGLGTGFFWTSLIALGAGLVLFVRRWPKIGFFVLGLALTLLLLAYPLTRGAAGDKGGIIHWWQTREVRARAAETAATGTRERLMAQVNELARAGWRTEVIYAPPRSSGEWAEVEIPQMCRFRILYESDTWRRLGGADPPELAGPDRLGLLGSNLAGENRRLEFQSATDAPALLAVCWKHK